MRGPDSTTTVLAPSANPSPYGPLTLTATVTPGPGGLNNGVPTGQVTFADGGTTLGVATLSTQGSVTTATFTTLALAVGPHALTASYGGDGVDYKPSPPSATVNETIAQATPTVALTPSGTAITSGQSETLTATVSAPAGVSPAPTGQVTFTDGSATLGTAPLTASGTTATATLSTTALAVGTHSLGAAYGGDANFAAAAAGPATVTVAAPPATKNVTTTSTTTATTRTATGGVGGAHEATLPKDTNIVPKGTVRVRLPDSRRYVSITEATSVPYGTTVDATNGRVELNLSTPNGTVKGELYGGSFVLNESKSGAVSATLTGGNFAVCPKTTAVRKAPLTTAATAATKASPGTVVRHLWANVKGNFTTNGRYASASVRGTEWLTQDRCDGTYVFVAFGAVRVVAFATHKSQLVKGGRSLLVRAP